MRGTGYDATAGQAAAQLAALGALFPSLEPAEISGALDVLQAWAACGR
jgi:hypothetical protein